VELDDGANIGIIDLQSCIQAVVSASPEITTKIDTDFTVYAYDFSEFETPLVGHGMLSKMLYAVATALGGQSKTMITGRVQKNVMGFFAKGGIKETLEVKLKLAPVPRPGAWADVIVGPDGDLRPSSRQFRGSMSSTGGMESINQLLYPHQGGDSEFVASIEYSPQVSRGPSPTASSYSRATTQQLSPGSISGSVIDESVPKKTGTRGRPRSATKKKAEEAVVEGPPARKRAKLTRAESRHKGSAFSNRPDSLRVAASTAASVRSFSISQGGEGDESADGQPRAPTPRPERQLAPRRRGRPPNSSRLSVQTSFEDIPSDGTVCPAPRNANDLDALDSAIYYGEEGDHGSSGPSPSDFPSSPPRLPTSPTPFATQDESMTPSSPQLPTISTFNDSGFMSETGFDRQEHTRSPQPNLTSQTTFLADTDILTENPPMPSEPRSDFVVECYGNPDLLPKKIPPRPVYPKRLLPYVPAMPYWMSPKSRAAASQSGSVPGSPIVPPLTLDGPISRPSTPLANAIANQGLSDHPVSSQSQTDISAERIEPGPPSLDRRFSQVSQMSIPDQFSLPPGYTSLSEQSRECFQSQTYSQPDYQVLSFKIPQGPAGATPSVYADSDLPDEPRSGTGASRKRNATSEPRSGGRERRKKDFKRNQIDKAIAAGEMPRYCANCGEIDTPTWRKAYTKLIEGKPIDISVSFKEGRVVGVENIETDAEGNTLRYRVYKKTLTVADQNENCYEMVRLCNRKYSGPQNIVGISLMSKACGLWFDKKGSMRPSAHWVKPPPGVAQKRAARQSKDNKDPKKRRKSTTDDAEAPTSDIGMSDAPQVTDPPIASEMPLRTLPNEIQVEASRPQMPITGRPRASSMQPQSSKMDDIAQWNNDVSAAMRDVQSSPVRLGTSKESPIEVDNEVSPKPTRRLLFPSPRKAGEFKTLEDVTPTKSVGGNKQSDKSSVVVVFEDINSGDKENQIPASSEDDDGLGFLFEETSPNKTPRSAKSGRALSDIFKTPTPAKQKRNALSPRSPNSSARRRRAALLMTPTRSSRGGSQAQQSTPFTAQLNQMFSDGLISSPSRGFDFSQLPPLDTPSRRSGILNFTDFSADDFLGTDMAMPSSPPKGLFAFYEDPSSDGLWSGAGIFGSSDAAHMLDSDEATLEEASGRSGMQVDLEAIIEEVVNEAGIEA